MQQMKDQRKNQKYKLTLLKKWKMTYEAIARRSKIYKTSYKKNIRG